MEMGTCSKHRMISVLVLAVSATASWKCEKIDRPIVKEVSLHVHSDMTIESRLFHLHKVNIDDMHVRI